MRESEILATTYDDLMSIYRYTAVEDETSHLSEMRPNIISSNIACALDKDTDSHLHLQGEVKGIIATYTVFTTPDVDIIEGDLLYIEHLGRKYECETGLPFKYPSHIEIPVILKERV